MIIDRPKEAKRINEIKKWTLVYGRRKTGKTFIVQHFVDFDEYFFVKTNRSILTKDNESITYDTFIEILKRSIEDKKIVVIDEFHRLGEYFFDFLHYIKKQGKLILISSTLFLSRKLISNKSALLGLFAEVPIGLISLKDTLKALKILNISKKEKLELAILLREPIAIDFFDEKKKARDTIATIIISSLKTIPALIGEVFFEEEREISAVYDGILRAISIGKVGSGKISSYLFSKKVIKKDDPSIIQQYLNNLIHFGIIKRIEILNKKRFVYKLVSPLARIYYYCDEKYNLSERKVDEKEIYSIINEIIPRIIEDNVREFLAELNGLREAIFEAKDFDIDGYLMKFNKPEIALEVKWKNIDKNELLKIEQNLQRIKSKRKILFLPEKRNLKSSIELFDVDDLIY